MATFDADLTDRLALALAEHGVLTQFRDLCLRYEPAKPADPGCRLTAPVLAHALEAAGAHAKSLGKFQTVQFGHETTGNWTWFGSIHIQSRRVLEVMVEGQDGGHTAGSTLHDLCTMAARQRPGIVTSGPPYPRPYYDDEPGRLAAMAKDLVALLARIQDVIRDTPGLRDPAEAGR